MHQIDPVLGINTSALSSNKRLESMTVKLHEYYASKGIRPAITVSVNKTKKTYLMVFDIRRENPYFINRDRL